MKREMFENLQEVTGKESGIVIYENGNVIVCNWAFNCQQGIPALAPFGGDVLGWGGELEVLEKKRSLNIKEELPENMDILYDENEDIEEIMNGEFIVGEVYTISNEEDTQVVVISPDDWH